MERRREGVAEYLSPALMSLVFVLAFQSSQAGDANDHSSVEGNLIANGESVELPYVYVWAEKEGLYEPSDPAWTIFFCGRPLNQHELGESVWDAPWLEIGVTETAEFTDQPELQVYSQSIRFSAYAGGNVTGGEYPEIEITGLGTDRISGRLWHSEERTFFEDTYRFDLAFEAPLSDPDAPIGEMLPPGGGPPGAAYLTWVETILSGDIAALQSIVPPELADQLGSAPPEEAAEEMAFMQSMTPRDVTIQSGSSDGEIAILEAEGQMDGHTINYEVTMTKMGEYWVLTKTSM